jgi:hypothetical protein
MESRALLRARERSLASALGRTSFGDRCLAGDKAPQQFIVLGSPRPTSFQKHRASITRLTFRWIKPPLKPKVPSCAEPARAVRGYANGSHALRSAGTQAGSRKRPRTLYVLGALSH